MRCACCGYEIVGNSHKIAANKYVCERCWNNPFLFFPKKLIEFETINYVSIFCDKIFCRKTYILENGSYNKEGGNMTEREDTIKVPVIVFEQKGVRNYLGVMKARDILDVWHVDRFIENQVIFRGYQRQEEEERMRQVYEYIEKCQIPIIPAILASLRMGSFSKTDSNTGILEIQRVPGALEIVDGQHRIGGFWVIKRLLEGEKIGRRRIAKEEIERLNDLLDFEVPVHFIDANAAAKHMEDLIDPEAKENMLKELGKERLGPEDVERVHFFVINKTQKAIRPSLKDTLSYLIYASGIKGIPIIEKEKWKAEIATPLTLDLHFDSDSPLRGMVNISGARGLQRPVQLASFVKSLEPLAKNEKFTALSPSQRLNFLKNYWRCVSKLIPGAFQQDTRKDYLVLRTLGIYILNRLANDIIDWSAEKGIKELSEDHIMSYLEPLREFNWKRDSPISSYGGEKGVREAYKEVIKFLSEKGIPEAKKRYEELTKKR